MGLDMYLYIEKYVSRNDYSRNGQDFSVSISPEFQALTEALGTDTLIRQDDWTGYTVQIPVGYWRKANAIHGWIVNECANGVDECQRIYVPREKAQELVDYCKLVLAENDKADELLPPVAGFFFGGYEIDEWYLQSIQQTIDIFEPLIASVDEVGAVYYQASW
jgi:hypothetical protein